MSVMPVLDTSNSKDSVYLDASNSKDNVWCLC